MLFNKTFVSKLRHDMMYSNMAKKSGAKDFLSKSSLDHISLVIKTKDVKLCSKNKILVAKHFLNMFSLGHAKK